MGLGVGSCDLGVLSREEAQLEVAHDQGGRRRQGSGEHVQLGQAREQRMPRLECHRGEHGRALCWQPNGRAQDRLELRGRDLGDRGVQQKVAQPPMHLRVGVGVGVGVG